MVLKPIPVLALALLAACVHPAPRPGMPARADLERALMPIDLCAGDESGTCDSFPTIESIRLLASRCVPLPSREGKRIVACRVSFREIRLGARPGRAYANQCLHLTAEPLQGIEGVFWSPIWNWSDDVADVEVPCQGAGI